MKNDEHKASEEIWLHDWDIMLLTLSKFSLSKIVNDDFYYFILSWIFKFSKKLNNFYKRCQLYLQNKQYIIQGKLYKQSKKNQLIKRDYLNNRQKM